MKNGGSFHSKLLNYQRVFPLDLHQAVDDRVDAASMDMIHRDDLIFQSSSFQLELQMKLSFYWS